MNTPRNPPRVVPLDADAHRSALDLLPWYVTGALDAQEHAEVESHLAVCARCRGELALERRLQAATAALQAPADAQRGFEALRTRIRTPPSRARRLRARGRAFWVGWQAAAPWARATMATQAALLVALLVGASWFERPTAPGGDAAYRALADAPAARATMLVRFRPDASERDIRAALRASGARVVDGPTVADGYLLAVPAGSADEALRRLREAAVVALAEPLQGPPR